MADRKKASLWLLVPVWTLATLAVLWTLLVAYSLTWNHWAKVEHSPSDQVKQVEPRR